ncbi:divergent protein kinase domain 2A-like [Branchiostoma floridae]|uniref:Divergent protein kinase domain 2A-like n=1 Tax=Branchiostoma floridae TaxID=7739 RepID=A0A9J7M2W9_BRAFL|nr:divergent protein kinase domain 2A-like [Branchiostoma floridae]
MPLVMKTSLRLHRILRHHRSSGVNVFLLLVLLIVVFIYTLHIKRREPVSTALNDFRFLWAETGTCPACFGHTCGLIQQGNFRRVNPNREQKRCVVSVGSIDGDMVIAKALSEEDVWRRYDSFICRTSPRPEACNASSFILESMYVTDAALKLSWLWEARKITHTERAVSPLCVSARFLQEVKQLYVENEGTELERVERAFMATSLLLDQEAVILRYFTTKSAIVWPFPKYYGACGRVVVLQHAGRTLDAFLDSPWEHRANIAVQLLQIVDTLREKDPDWILFFLDVSMEDFAVDRSGRVRLIDFEDVMVIDRQTVADEGIEEGCNEQCYMNFQQELMSDYYHCKDILRYTQMMYANICVRILSNRRENEEKAESEERSEEKGGQSGEEKPNKPQKGLLYDPPDDMRESLESALGHCVHETQPGGRLKAVLTLKEILK